MVWETTTWKERTSIEVASQHGIIQFSPNGRWLAGAGEEGVIRVWNLFDTTRNFTFSRHDNWISGLSFTADGCKLVSSSGDATLLVWDFAAALARLPKAEAAGQIDDARKAWKNLQNEDAYIAYLAMRVLIQSPQLSLPLIRDNLPPSRTVAKAAIDRWIAHLDSAQFAERDAALRELEAVVEQAEPALRRLVAGNPPLEAKRRAEQLLARLENPLAVEGRLQQVRALEVLEQIGDGESRRILQTLANGEPSAWLTREAKASLDRLAKFPAAN
jgi:hypothetical protein